MITLKVLPGQFQFRQLLDCQGPSVDILQTWCEMCVFSASQSCSKAGRTMDAVSAFRKSSNVKSQKTLQKRKLSYAKKKVKRGARIMDLLASLRSWKLKSWITFCVHFFVLSIFWGVIQGMYLSESICIRCFSQSLRYDPLWNMWVGGGGVSFQGGMLIEIPSRALMSTQRWRRTLCLHEPAQGNET